MYEYDSRVRLTEVDQNQRMSLHAILNAFQDCSTFHSEDLGVGMEYLEAHNRMWVLKSWRIIVYEYPKLAEHIRVGTWPYEFGKLTGKRNFCLLDREGHMAACADSLWVFMDTKRMRPARLDDKLQEIYKLEEKLPIEYKEEKIQLLEERKLEEPFPIHAWHLDVNHHVNNGQYVQLACEYLPENFCIHQMCAEYKKSAVLGDIIYPQVGWKGEICTVVLGDKDGNPYAVIEFQ